MCVAIGLLGLMITPAQEAAVLLVPSLTTNVWQGLAGGELRGLLRRLWSMLAGVCIGTFIDAVTLPRGNSGQATVWLGLALAVYAALGLAKVHFFVPPRAEGWIGLVTGIATGVISVATGIFAIPGVPYVQSLRLDRDRLVQALGLWFTVSTVALAGALYHLGELHLSLVWPALLALGAALVCMRLGQLVRGKVTPGTFRLWFFIGLLALGTHLALRGLI